MFSIERAKILLMSAGVFFDAEDFDDIPEMGNKYLLNMNDVWFWACADYEEVKEEELPEVALLFYRYGSIGLLYWVSQKRNARSEFSDINRHIDFVRHEEDLIKSVPSSSKRAYKKVTYKLGEDETLLERFIKRINGAAK